MHSRKTEKERRNTLNSPLHLSPVLLPGSLMITLGQKPSDREGVWRKTPGPKKIRVKNGSESNKTRRHIHTQPQGETHSMFIVFFYGGSLGFSELETAIYS